MNVKNSNLILFILIINITPQAAQFTIAGQVFEDVLPAFSELSKTCGKCDNATYDPKCYEHHNLLLLFWNECHKNESCISPDETDLNKCVNSYCELPAAVFSNGQVHCNCSKFECKKVDRSEYCGSDGFFYWNECYAKKLACFSQKKFEPTSNLSICENSKKCSDCQPTEVCDHDTIGRIQCGCPNCDVELNSTEVCDETDVPFPSECFLRKDACERHRNSYEARNCTIIATTTTNEQNTKNRFDWNSAFEVDTYLRREHSATDPPWTKPVTILGVIAAIFVISFFCFFCFNCSKKCSKSKKISPFVPQEEVKYRYAPKTQVLPINMEDY